MEGEHGFGNSAYAYGASVGRVGKAHLPGVAHILERYKRDEYGADIPDRERCEANARLIAAAPDLLAACEKALRSIIENTSPSMRPAWACATTEMLHAVLVKAGVRDCPMCEYAEGTCGECRAAIQKAEGQGR